MGTLKLFKYIYKIFVYILIIFTDIKYQIHLCHVGLKQSHQAITVLQSIPGKQRNAKINMALARLYQQGGMERSAITSYKEVLRVRNLLIFILFSYQSKKKACIFYET